MAEITDKIKLPVRVEQHREAIGETGDYDYFWLLLDSDGTRVAWWPDGDKEKGIAEQIRDSLNEPTASPTQSDNGELLELYAKSITTHSPDMVQDFRAGRVSSVAIALLTKFANAMRPPLAQLDQEIVERYAKLAMSIPAGVFRAAVDDDDEDLDRMKRVLTRFASEIGVDTEKVCLWSYTESNINRTLCGNSNPSGYDGPSPDDMKWCYFCGGRKVEVSKEQLAAALKAAGGGK